MAVLDVSRDIPGKIWKNFGNALAVSFFRRRARLRYYFQCSIDKRSGKIGRNVSFNESHVLY